MEEQLDDSRRGDRLPVRKSDRACDLEELCEGLDVDGDDTLDLLVLNGLRHGYCDRPDLVGISG